jgi:hypothetical protein
MTAYLVGPRHPLNAVVEDGVVVVHGFVDVVNGSFVETFPNDVRNPPI